MADMGSAYPFNPFYLNTLGLISIHMDPNIAWEEFSSQGSRKVEEVNKGMTSINGKLDALLQLANESNVNSARTAEIVPQVMGDTAAMDAQAAEMAATGGMPPMPPEGAPAGDVPPDDMGGVPPEEPMPEEAPADVPPEGDVKNEPMPPVDAGATDMGPEPAPDMGGVPPEEAPMDMGGQDLGLGDIDWSAYSIDNAYEDFEEALKDEAKEALDAGDTQRVAAITQVMDAMRMIWTQSGVADETPAPDMGGQVAPGVDGIPAPDMMKSEGEDMTEMEDATKAQLEPIKEETIVEEEVEKADDMGGDIAEGETSAGEAVESVEASEGCKKSELEGAEKARNWDLERAQLVERLMNEGYSMDDIMDLAAGFNDYAANMRQKEAQIQERAAAENAPYKPTLQEVAADHAREVDREMKGREMDRMLAQKRDEARAVEAAKPTPTDTGLDHGVPNLESRDVLSGRTVPASGSADDDAGRYYSYADTYGKYSGDALKSEGAPLPTFKSMMEARETSGRPFDCSADEDMLRGAKMGQVYKSENGTFMVINSSRPNVASSLGIQAKIEPQDLHKSFAPKFEEKEEDPLRKSLKNDWDNYMAYKETDSF